MRDDLGVQFPYATPVASAAHRLSGRSSSALSLLDCIVRYLVETSRRREMKQSLTNTVDVPLDFTSSSSTHHDINIEIGSDAPIPRTNSTNNLILTNLSQTHSQSQITQGVQTSMRIDPTQCSRQTALPAWEHLAYNICRVAGLTCLSAQIVVFVFFFVPLFSR